MTEPKMTNTRVLLAARPHGYPKVSDFEVDEVPVQAPEPGEILVRTLFLSLDPGALPGLVGNETVELAGAFLEGSLALFDGESSMVLQVDLSGRSMKLWEIPADIAQVTQLAPSPDGRYLSFTRSTEAYDDVFKITFRPIPDYDGIRPQRYVRLSESVYKDKYGDKDNLDWLYPGE